MECAKCRQNFDPNIDPAALIFSPPDEENTVKKYHVCIVCWRWTLKEWIKRRPKMPTKEGRK